MKSALFVLVGFTCLAAFPAIADEAPKPPETPAAVKAPEAAKPMPRAGLWSVQLDGPAFPMWQGPSGYNDTRGFGTTIPTSGGQTSIAGGAAGSLGYSLTDLIELGASVGFVAKKPLVGDSVLGLNFSPFLKLNLSADMNSTVNFFGLVACAINYTGANGNTQTATLIIPELAAGVEFMLTHSFGISVYVPITAAFNTSGGSNTLIGLGLGYGLVGYF